VLTPRECLRIAADITLNLTPEEKSRAVEKLLNRLKIQSCSDTRVGSDVVKGVSGGERKRTSIGVELIANPSVLFVDEPTTGLDSHTALSIVQLMN